MKTEKLLFDGFPVSNGFQRISYEMSKYSTGYETMRGLGKIFEHGKMTTYDQIHLGFKVSAEGGTIGNEKIYSLEDVAIMYSMFRTRGIIYLENKTIAERYSGIFGQNDIHGVFVMLERMHVAKDRATNSYSVSLVLYVVEEPISAKEGAVYKNIQYKKYREKDEMVRELIRGKVSKLNDSSGLTFKLLNKKSVQLNQFLSNERIPETIDEQIYFDRISDTLDSLKTGENPLEIDEGKSVEELRNNLKSTIINFDSEDIEGFEFVTHNNITELNVKGKQFPFKQLLGIGSTTMSFSFQLDEELQTHRGVIQKLKSLSRANGDIYKVVVQHPISEIFSFQKAEISQIILENHENILMGHLRLELNAYPDNLDGGYLNSDSSAEIIEDYGVSLEKPFNFVLEDYAEFFFKKSVLNKIKNKDLNAYSLEVKKFLKTVIDSNSDDGQLADGQFDKVGSLSRTNYSNILNMYSGYSIWNEAIEYDSNTGETKRLRGFGNSALNITTDKPSIDFIISTIKGYNSIFNGGTSSSVKSTPHEFPGAYTLFDIIDTLGISYSMYDNQTFINTYSPFFDSNNLSEHKYSSSAKLYNDSFVRTILLTLFSSSGLNGLSEYENECVRFIFTEYMNNFHQALKIFDGEEKNSYLLASSSSDKSINGPEIRKKIRERSISMLKHFNNSIASNVTRDKFAEHMKVIFAKAGDKYVEHQNYKQVSIEIFEKIRNLFHKELVEYQMESSEAIFEKMYNIYFSKILFALTSVNYDKGVPNAFKSSQQFDTFLDGYIFSMSLLSPFMMMSNVATGAVGTGITAAARIVSPYYGTAYQSVIIGTESDNSTFFKEVKTRLDEIFYEDEVRGILKRMFNESASVDFFRDMNTYLDVDYKETRIHPMETFFSHLEREDSFRTFAQEAVHNANSELKEEFLNGDYFNLLGDEEKKMLIQNYTIKAQSNENLYFPEEGKWLKLLKTKNQDYTEAVKNVTDDDLEFISLDDNLKKKILGVNNVFSEIDEAIKVTTEDYSNIVPTMSILLTKNSYKNAFLGQQRYIDVTKLVGLTNIISMKIQKDPETKIETLELMIADNSKSFFESNKNSLGVSNSGKTFQRISIENGDELNIETLVYSNYNQTSEYSRDIETNTQRRFKTQRVFNGFVADSIKTDGVFIIKALSYASVLYDETFDLVGQDWTVIPNGNAFFSALKNGVIDKFRSFSTASNEKGFFGGKTFNYSRITDYNNHINEGHNSFNQTKELCSSFNSVVQAMKKTSGYNLAPFYKTSNSTTATGSLSNQLKIQRHISESAFSLPSLTSVATFAGAALGAYATGGALAPALFKIAATSTAVGSIFNFNFMDNTDISLDQSARLFENINNIDRDADVYGFKGLDYHSGRYGNINEYMNDMVNGSTWTLTHTNNVNVDEVSNSKIDFKGTIGNLLGDIQKFKNVGAVWDVRNYGDYSTLILGRSNYFYRTNETGAFLNPEKTREIMSKMLSGISSSSIPASSVEFHNFIISLSSFVKPSIMSNEVSELNTGEVEILKDKQRSETISVSDIVYERDFVRPFSKTHIVSSGYNLIGNKISVATNLANTVKIHFDARFYSSENWNPVEFFNYERQVAEISFIPGKENGTGKELEMDAKHFATHRAQANEMASQVLINELKKSYSGKIVIMFKPDICYGDTIILTDSITNTSGKFLVKSFEHIYSAEGSFTAIEPEAYITLENPFVDALGAKLAFNVKAQLMERVGNLNVNPGIVSKFNDVMESVLNVSHYNEKLLFFFEKEAGALVRRKNHKIPFKSFIKFAPVTISNQEQIPEDIDAFFNLSSNVRNNWSFITEIPSIVNYKLKHFGYHIENMIRLDGKNKIWKAGVSVVRFIDSVIFMDIFKLFFDNMAGRRASRVMELVNGDTLETLTEYINVADIIHRDGFYDGKGEILEIMGHTNNSETIGSFNIDYNTMKTDSASGLSVDEIMNSKASLINSIAESYDVLVVRGFYTKKFGSVIAERFSKKINADYHYVGSTNEIYEDGASNIQYEQCEEYYFVINREPGLKVIEPCHKTGNGSWHSSFLFEKKYFSKHTVEEKETTVKYSNKNMHYFASIITNKIEDRNNSFAELYDRINKEKHSANNKFLYLITNFELEKVTNSGVVRNIKNNILEHNYDVRNERYEYLIHVGSKNFRAGTVGIRLNHEHGVHDFFGTLSRNDKAFEFSRVTKPIYTTCSARSK